MSSPSPGQRLRSKTSDLHLFRNNASASSRSRNPDQIVPPVPEMPVSESKTKRKLAIFGKRRKSGSTISTSPSPSRPSYDTSSDPPRRSGEATRSSYRAVQKYPNGPSVVTDYAPSQPLPSRLPPLDVSPPSLGFSTTGSSPTTSLQFNAMSSHRPPPLDTGSRNRSPAKNQQRPVITVFAPTNHNNVEVDGDVFVSPRSAPAPPVRPPRSADRDLNIPLLAHIARTPASPLRFPIPPGEEMASATSFSDDRLLRGDRPEFNSGFSFPSKEPRRDHASIREHERIIRGASVDVLSNRNNDKLLHSRKKIDSSPFPSKLALESRTTSECLSGSDNYNHEPPTIPLPAPPSAFSIDSDDQFGPATSLATMSIIPSLNSNGSLVSLQSRAVRSSSRSKTVSSTRGSTSNSPQRRPSVDERQPEQVGKAGFEHTQKQSVGEMREQGLLRVEINAQRVKFDDLSNKVGKLIEKHEMEMTEMCKRIDILEEEIKDMDREIKTLTLIVLEEGGSVNCRTRTGDLLETPASMIEGTENLLKAPSDVEYPSSPFQYARRLYSTTSKPEKRLRRSNTMPDGFDGVRAGSQPMTSKKSNRSSTTWVLATAGLLPKFARGGLSKEKGTSPGSGLGFGFTVPDSPMVGGSPRFSVSELPASASHSSSMPALTTAGSTTDNSKSSNLSGIGEIPLSTMERLQWARGRVGREEKGSKPNMEEILAKLRTFESHSPAFR